jgi:hypothetical protein
MDVQRRLVLLEAARLSAAAAGAGQRRRTA